jgi:hypothetical protein
MMVRIHYLLIVLIQLQTSIEIFANGYNGVAALDPKDGKTCADASINCDESAYEDDNGARVDSPWQFMQAFSSFGVSWNHVFKEYISVIQGAEGIDLKGDVLALDMDEGLKLMQTMVREAATASKDEDWSFSLAPLEDFGRTIDDVLVAFLRWAAVDTHSSYDDKTCQLVGGVNYSPFFASPPTEVKGLNVSKAFRRLTSYIQWIHSVSSDLRNPPVTYESISPSLSVFALHVTHDSCNRLVWWVNLGKTDMAAVKSQSPRETTRMFVWIAHLLFLDDRAQANGLVIVDDVAEIGFWSYMTMLPIQVGISLDRFLISVTPLKAKNVVLMHRPKWMEIGYGLMSWFLTDKMRNRVTMVSNGEEDETLERVVGGAGFIPKDFGHGKGEVTTDIIAQHRG